MIEYMHAYSWGHRAFAGLLLLLIVSPVSIEAQSSQFKRNQASLPNSESVQSQFRKARELIDQQKYREAFQRLDELRNSGFNNVISVENHPGLFQSLPYLIRKTLYSLPENGKKIYRTQHDPKAQSRYQIILKDPSRKQLLEFARKHPLTTSSADALYQLARISWKRGNFQKALKYLNEQRQFEYRSQLRHQNIMASMWCLAQTGKVHRLQKIWDSYQSDLLKETILWNGNYLKPSKLYQRLKLMAAKGEQTQNRTSRSAATSDWNLPGGTPRNNQLQGPDIKLNNPHFSETYPRGASNVPTKTFYLNRRAMKFYYPNFPTLSKGLLTVHNGRTVRSWKLNPDSEPNKRGNKEPTLSWTFQGSSFQPNEIMVEERITYTGAVWNDQYITNLVTGRGRKETQLFDLHVRFPIPRRSLFSLDLQSGEVRWKKGGDNARTTFFREASFSAGPVVKDDTIYTIAQTTESSVDTPSFYAIALDAGSGKLQWKTFLTKSGIGINLFGNPIRENVVSVPAVDDNYMYVSTNVGVVAAVNRNDGSIKWMYRYKEYPTPPRKGLRPVKQELRWRNNLPIRLEGALLVTPTNSPFLLAFDPASGKLLWKQQYRSLEQQIGDNPRWIVPYRNNQYMISGENGARIYSVDKHGAPISEVFKPDTRLFGRPAVTGDHVYFSTRKKLVKMETRTSKSNRMKWMPDDSVAWNEDQNPGSVFVRGGMIAVISADHMTVFYDREKMQQFLSNATEYSEPPLISEGLASPPPPLRPIRLVTNYLKIPEYN